MPLWQANLTGAYPIIAIDVLESKLARARELGASHTINASEKNPFEQIVFQFRGVDCSIEAIGKVEVMNRLADCVRFGGQAIIVGAAAMGSMLSLDAVMGLLGKSLAVSPGGMTNPGVDIPKWLDLYMLGKLPVDKLVDKTYSLSEVNKALEALEKGEIVKGIIKF